MAQYRSVLYTGLARCALEEERLSSIRVSDLPGARKLRGVAPAARGVVASLDGSDERRDMCARRERS